MTSNNTSARFEIPSANVDTSSITVTVQQSATNSHTEEYLLSDDITASTANTRVYYIEENENLNYTIQFGDGIIGRRPDVGNIVIVTYLDTSGSDANEIKKFNFIEPISQKFSGNVKVTTVQSSSTGSDKEEIDRIRLRAPQYYAAQNRCVTTRDYESILMKDFPDIEAVSIWGGEENVPPVYGKVYMSIKTRGYYALTNLEKDNIKNSLIKSRNVITVSPVIIDPDYIFITLRGKIYYDPGLTTKTANEIINLVKQTVETYADNQLNTYRSVFKKSKLQAAIEACDASITGSDITVYLQNRQLIDLTSNKKYEFNFKTPIEKGTDRKSTRLNSSHT